jgi:uncharacterized protein (DUF2267 family)
MLSLDLFNSRYERKLQEGAVDDTIAHLIEPLSRRAMDIRTQLRSRRLDPAQVAKLEKEYEELVQKRLDIILDRKTQTQEQQVPSKQDPFAYVKPEPKGIGDIQDPKSKMTQLQQRAKKGPLANVGAGLKAFIKGEPEPMDEEQDLSGSSGPKAYGVANFQRLVKANMGNIPTVSLEFIRSEENFKLDQAGLDLISDYYDGLESDQAKNYFIYRVLPSGDETKKILKQLGWTPQQVQQPLPGIPTQGELPLQEKKKFKNSSDLEAGDVKVARELQKLRAQYPASKSDVEAVASAEIDSTERSQRQLAAIRGANEKQDALLKQLVDLDQEQGREIDGLDKENNSLEQRLAQVQATNDQLQQTIGKMTGTKKAATVANVPPTGSADMAQGGIIDVGTPGPSAADVSKTKPEPTTSPAMSAMARQIQGLGTASPGSIRGPAPGIGKTASNDPTQPGPNVSGSDIKNEGHMKELDAMRQDLERMNDRQFYTAYGISKVAFQQKYRTLLKPALDEHGGGIGPKQHWQDLMQENKLAVGDPVIVTAPNEFEGKTGEIYDFAPSGKFVIVDLYNHGKHSMHLSDVEYNQYADDQEQDDWYDELDESANPKLDQLIKMIQSGKITAASLKDPALRPRLTQLVQQADPQADIAQLVATYAPAAQVKATNVNDLKSAARRGVVNAPYPTTSAGAPTYAQQHSTFEGWSDAMVARRTGTPRTPYSVYIKGKKWKDFENDDHAENVANKLRAKFKSQGKDPSVITIAPTDIPEGMAEGKNNIDNKIIHLLTNGIPADAIARKLDIPVEWVHEVAKYNMPDSDIDYNDPRNSTQGRERFGEQGVAEVKADPTGSWVVYNGNKVVKFKTHSGAKAYAEKNGGKIASSEFYADRIQGVAETALNPRDPAGDLAAKRKALQDLGMNKGVDQQAVQQRKLDLDREAKAKGVADRLEKGLTETVTDVKSEMARVYKRLAPKIERYRDSFLAGQLYDELENIAELHGAEREFKQMMNGARNRAHMEYDTNPGGFHNWFWFLPFEDQDMSEGDDQLLEGIKDTASATAVIACLLAGGNLSGCATAPQQTTTAQAVKTGQDIGRIVYNARNITRAGTEEEARQELRNILRGMTTRPEELNNSNILRIWRRVNEPKQQNETKEPKTKQEYDRAVDSVMNQLRMERNSAVRQMLNAQLKVLQDLGRPHGWHTDRVIREDTAALAAEDAILKRIFVKHRDLMMEYGPDKITQAAESVAYDVGDMAHISDEQINGWVRQVEFILGARP